MAEQQYAWIVHYDNYGDKWISGVFDSEEKAQAHMDEWAPGKRRWVGDFDYTMERQRLNPSPTWG